MPKSFKGKVKTYRKLLISQVEKLNSKIKKYNNYAINLMDKEERLWPIKETYHNYKTIIETYKTG